MAKSPKKIDAKPLLPSEAPPPELAPEKAAKPEKPPKAPKKQKTTKVEKAPEPTDPIGRLFRRIELSRDGNPEKSYTAKLFARGRAKIAQKLGEEAVETTIELVKGDRKGVIGESADLLYHLMVCWVDAGVTPDDVWSELQRRQGISGLVEKASRKPS